jgi:transcriptional regulator with GAF, ATPase, and Fis domain
MRIRGDLGTLEHELVRARQPYLDLDPHLQRTLQAPGERELLRTLQELRVALQPVAEPQQHLARTSEVASRVLPHDHASLVLFPEGGQARVFSIGQRASLPESLVRVLARGSGIAAPAQLIADAALLDLRVAPADLRPVPEPRFEADGLFRCGVRAPLEVAGRIRAELLLLSRSSYLYVEQDLLFAQLIAYELGLGLTRSHAELGDSALWTAFDVSEQLLRTLAGALDIREVFPQVSSVAARLLPHDRLTMSFVDGEGTCVLRAVSNPDGPSSVRVTRLDSEPLLDGAFKIVDDLRLDKPEAVYDPPDTRDRTLAAGYRSLLSIRLSAREQQFGLSFWSKRVAAFGRDQVPTARRIAEHVALAVSHQQLAEAAGRAVEAQSRAAALEARVQSLSDELESRAGYAGAVGDSEAWRSVLKAAQQVALTDTTVLLTGESGTGKEVIARFIHRASAKRGGPFVAVNCAALPEQLLESELFGHERGAFTGAQHGKPGQIELASGGVLFLDEVGEMSLSAQAKVLRVLQEREFQRVGGTRTIKANVRVIAATNRELRRALTRGDFREDLYYRLQVFEIRLPPLRLRPLDILPLSEAFLTDIGRSFGRPPAGMTREARRALLDYAWPGNVRELRNVLERAAIVCEGGLIAPEHLALAPEDFTGAPASVPASSTNVKAIERQLVEQVLRECQGNKSQAARRLGLTRKQLYVRLQKYEADPA